MERTFKEQCIRLRRQDKSIGEIVKITGRPKSSVYTHIHNIPLSATKLARVQAAAIARIKKYPAARKGKSVRHFSKFNTWSADEVLLVAHLLFDGEIGRACIYNNRSEALIGRVERLMGKWYEYPPKRWKNQKTGVWRISYYNVALAIYLRQKADELLRTISHASLEQKKAFLTAFFDDEGCMDFRPKEKRRQVRGYQKDLKILRIVRTLLLDLGIESRLTMPNEVVVRGRENLAKFEKEIGFSPGVSVNGNRSNSRWKKHIEKRKLLRMAIESYQG